MSTAIDPSPDDQPTQDPEPSDGTDLLARWLADDDQGTVVDDASSDAGRPSPRGSWRRVLLVLAGMCWLVATMLLLQLGMQPPEAASTPSPSSATPEPVRQQLSEDELKAAAVMLVRQALTTPGDGGQAMYVDHAVAERVERVGSAEWVVRVQALVLIGDQVQWHDQQLQVYVVPVGVRDGEAFGLEHPWPVGERALTFTEPAWQSTNDDRRPVLAALREAGYEPSEDTTIEAAAELPAIARVTLDAAEGGPRHVWVRLSDPVEVLGRDQALDQPDALTQGT